MSGLFDRLTRRAQGGDALTGLSMVRPLPRLYQDAGTTSEVALEVEHEVEAGIGPHAPSSAGVAPPRQLAAPVPSSLQVSSAPPKPTRDHHRGEVSENSMAAASTAFLSAVTKPAPEPSVPSRPIRPAAPPSPVSPDGEPPRARRGTSIEQAIEAIESTPPSPARTSSAQGLLRERGDAQSAPLSVSIGRIDIVVAPPPIAAAPLERTRGFQNYARLRRGLAR